MVLTDKEREELHTALREYLHTHGMAATVAAFDGDLSAKAGGVFSDKEGTLERRWNTLRRLNTRNLELEATVTQLQAQLAEARDPTKAKVSSSNVLPMAPAMATFSGHRDSLTCVALHPTEPLCYSASEDGSIRVWDVQSRSHVETIRGHTEAVTCIAIEPTKNAVFASSSNDCTIKLTDCLSFECRNTLIGHEDAVSVVSWVGDAEQTLVSGARDGSIRVWDGARGAMRHSVKTLAWVRALASSPLGGGILVIGGNDEQLSFYANIRSSAPNTGLRQTGGLATLEGHTNIVMCAAISTFEVDTVIIEAHGTTQQKTELKEVQKKRMASATEASAPVVSAAWLASIDYQPKFAASGARDKNIFLYDLQQGGKQVMKLEGHQNWVRCVAFTKGGRHLMSCGDDGMLLVHDLVLRKAVRSISAHGHFCTALALHPHNKPFMVTGGADCQVKVWQCN